MNKIHLSHSLAIFLIGSTTIGLGAHALAPLPAAKAQTPPLVVFELEASPQPKAAHLSSSPERPPMLAIRNDSQTAEKAEDSSPAPHVFISKNGERIAIAIGQTIKF